MRCRDGSAPIWRAKLAGPAGSKLPIGNTFRPWSNDAASVGWLITPARFSCTTDRVALWALRWLRYDSWVQPPIPRPIDGRNLHRRTRSNDCRSHGLQYLHGGGRRAGLGLRSARSRGAHLVEHLSYSASSSLSRVEKQRALALPVRATPTRTTTRPVLLRCLPGKVPEAIALLFDGLRSPLERRGFRGRVKGRRSRNGRGHADPQNVAYDTFTAAAMPVAGRSRIRKPAHSLRINSRDLAAWREGAYSRAVVVVSGKVDFPTVFGRCLAGWCVRQSYRRPRCRVSSTLTVRGSSCVVPLRVLACWPGFWPQSCLGGGVSRSRGILPHLRSAAGSIRRCWIPPQPRVAGLWRFALS